MAFLQMTDLPFLITDLLRLIILTFFIALLGLFAGLGIQKNRLASRAKKEAEQVRCYTHQLSAVEAGAVPQFDPLRSMRDLVCLGRAYRATDELHPSSVRFRIDSPDYAQQISILKQGMKSSNWGVRYQSIDTIANLRLHTLFDFLLQHSTEEKNNNVAGHCLHVCALLLRSPAEFDALVKRLDHDDQLSTNLVEGLVRIAIQKLQENQNTSMVENCLTACLLAPGRNCLFRVGLINAIGKQQMLGLKEVLINLARHSPTEHIADSAHADPATLSHENAIALAVMRAIACFNQYDGMIGRQLESDEPTMQVVALCASLHCDDGALALIAHQLRSLHFDVRYAAAQTLAKMGTRGRIFLKIAQMGNDRYARNIAAFALAIG